MKLISLRKFRDSIADIQEPVEVARRDPDGSIQIIGTWTPGIVQATSPREGVLREVRNQLEPVPGPAFNSRPFTPVPKR